MREIGLDVHRDFCEVAIAEAGEVRSAGRVETTPEVLELFAQSLGADDRVALEVSGNAWEIATASTPNQDRGHGMDLDGRAAWAMRCGAPLDPGS